MFGALSNIPFIVPKPAPRPSIQMARTNINHGLKNYVNTFRLFLLDLPTSFFCFLVVSFLL